MFVGAAFQGDLTSEYLADRPWPSDGNPRDLTELQLRRRLSRCDTSKSLRTWLREFAQSIGFYGGRYLHLGHAPDGAREAAARPIRMLSTAINDDTGAASCTWPHDDPAIGKARTCFAPFVWSTRAAADLSERQRVWLNAERMRGVGAGIAVPIQDYQAGPAFLSLFGIDEAESVRLLDERCAQLAFLGAQFHAQAKDIVPLTDAATKRTLLTHREIECLRLAAIGSTVSASAAALGIASRTVEFHLGNAVTKLSAVNKIHAVAIATSNRLIAL